jgi:[protein-PII] uridylyltransferase
VSVAAPAAVLAGAGDDLQWCAAARAWLTETQDSLASRFDAGEGVSRLLRARTECVDAVVRQAWARCLPDDTGLALLATGGYGRGELFPHSDVDLLVLAEPRAQQDASAALSRLFALLWDAGIAASHAVRSISQCREAVADATVMTALLELRELAGRPGVAAELSAAVAVGKVWPAREFFIAKREEQRVRHVRFNDTAYNLEPNVKDGPGGLRDLHTLAWMARRIHGVPGLSSLVPLGSLGEDEFDSLRREYRALSRLRFGLHLVAGRAEERLLFDHQKALAERLGLKDERRDNLAVEQMMQGFFRSAATVLRINDRLLQRFEEQLEGEGQPQPLAEDLVSRRGYLSMPTDDWLSGRPDRVLTLFSVWASHPGLRGLHSETARAMAESLPEFPAYTDATPEIRRQFIALVRGPSAVRTLSRMARLGVLGCYLPAFGEVAGRMQYDLFHVYTVDQHTLEVMRNVESFASGDSGKRFALGPDLWPKLRKPELLLLAALFHDIAKGRGGDHSELGAADAREFCLAHGMVSADATLVAWLVANHLLMSTTAQRQDISDPEVVARFATRIGDREHLDYLYLLTVADIAGTSPKLWNAWKDQLMADLYASTRFALRRGLEHPVFAAERIDETREAARSILLAEGMSEADIDRAWDGYPEESFLRYRPEQVAWQTHGVAALASPRQPLVLARPMDAQRALEVFVYSPDRDGLFAAVTATLDRMGLTVIAARVLNADTGMSLDSFQVLATDQQRTEPAQLAPMIERRLGAILVRASDQVRPSRRALPRLLRHFRVPVRIEFSEHGSDRTQLTLVCTDRPGLLAEIAVLLRQHRVRVHDARIATFGERVEDFFLLSDFSDRALSVLTTQTLTQALMACVEGGYEHGKADSAS